MRLAFAAALLATFLPTTPKAAPSKPLALEQRVAAQRAIEEVYWRHRIWPSDNSTPKPPLDDLMPESTLRAKVEDYLKKSNVLEAWWHRPISGDQLQAELDRIARGSRDPRMLQELFDALGGDATLIAETLARQSLVDRLARSWYASDNRIDDGLKPSFDAWWKRERVRETAEVATITRAFSLPALDPVGCTNDTWSPTPTDVPDTRHGHTAVWTGAEMIVWGGIDYADAGLRTGGRYDPATDTWTPTSTGENTPRSSTGHTAVWTGTEMIVWGGVNQDTLAAPLGYMNRGARYNPITDSWTPTSMGANVPVGRIGHTAVWTGSEMIVWGGGGSPDPSTSGGRYNPATDSWTPTSTAAGVPSSRVLHTAIWTGTEMIVWGGSGSSGLSTGGRYNPITDAWAPTSTGPNTPVARSWHTAVWTGTEMIVWGGNPQDPTNSGARYNPITDGWTPTSMGTNLPTPRSPHTAVWTGTRMIVWGGVLGGIEGGEYDPASDTWHTMTASGLTPRREHTAIWTGTEMIVWGGRGIGLGAPEFNTGARYDPSSDSWVPTSMGAAVAAARAEHTAIWTGAEMIVWGGRASYDFINTPRLNTGGRYTPATNSWIPTSIGENVPEPRSNQSAVWTGTEMIVWGGSYIDVPISQTHLVNTGGRYNPLTDSWAATSTGANVPSPRQDHAAVWTGTEMIVAPLNLDYPGARYDPVADAWAPISTGANAPHGVYWGGYVWTGTEMILWGGGGQGVGGRYNPSTDSWLSISTGVNAPSFRFAFSAVWTGTEMIVWGGSTSTSSGGRYNPTTDTWLPTSTGTNVASARKYHAAIWSGSEMIVWGGSFNGPGTPKTGGGRYNPSTDSWAPVSLGPNYPASGEYLTAVWTGTEMIVWGGDPGTATGGRYCACPSGRLVYRDADGDGYGDPGVSRASCDGSVPAGYVVDYTDCNDAAGSAHPGATETCNAQDDDCNGLVDEGALEEDSDGDQIHNLCDNCRFVANVAQSDFDHDGQGDACDLNDGLIYEWRDDKTSVSWQAEQGPTSWNVYVGDLAVLKATGVYSQVPSSNPLASRQCGVSATTAGDPTVPAPGKASFSLVAGVTGGIEGSLGSSSSGPRPNMNPCP